ncbi:hypothetical protein DACRYDRAFT_112519 [Dacryopinax primogenitus]|uniref:Uncharacterized protein n=1 Tax=Dacryopinax primogenitus (strain DJM 731) TaxID=1858805 RepID=M5FQ44_DACPD|nr:uncharacterized protein DACRYDRAFT_112519 [Dacryopinax primogenitus]EJT96714.1 hypothetical protein DACRYDRAFT_112519 [Dacryopinax primogenitus]
MRFSSRDGTTPALSPPPVNPTVLVVGTVVILVLGVVVFILLWAWSRCYRVKRREQAGDESQTAVSQALSALERMPSAACSTSQLPTYDGNRPPAYSSGSSTTRVTREGEVGHSAVCLTELERVYVTGLRAPSLIRQRSQPPAYDVSQSNSSP